MPDENRTGFNEAPAERGGEPRPQFVVVYWPDLASMRPPLNAGENASRRQAGDQGHAGFNEAPAERGGELATTCPPSAAILVASMRPPLNAGENLGEGDIMAALKEALQ